MQERIRAAFFALSRIPILHLDGNFTPHLAQSFAELFQLKLAIRRECVSKMPSVSPFTRGPSAK
jgi:hypothetical protein